jgi:hypothetical protein
LRACQEHSLTKEEQAHSLTEEKSKIQSLPFSFFLFLGQGPIHLAAQGGHSDVLRALHWLGAAVNAKEGKGGRTALHYAVERGHLSALLVLANECRVDLEADNYAGLTAYQIASASNNGVESSSLPLARELRRCGAIPHDLPMDDSSSEEEEEEEQNNSVNNLNGRSSQQQHHHNHCP